MGRDLAPKFYPVLSSLQRNVVQEIISGNHTYPDKRQVETTARCVLNAYSCGVQNREKLVDIARQISSMRKHRELISVYAKSSVVKRPSASTSQYVCQALAERQRVWPP